MSRESDFTNNRIALLATGDEVINGDILNSNAQIIAQKLFKQGFPVGIHMTAPDHIKEIEESISYLLTKHRALIMTGGLGPTSDDLTRYALSNVSQRPLQFDEATWNDICERFRVLGYKGEPPAGNRQQALFPEGSVILPNTQGTAAACLLEFDEKIVFMLPGPPFECLPLVDTVVIPFLKEKNFQEILHYDHWLLFGIGESLIADKLDEAVKPFNCTTGYRIAFPYIEFKLYSNNEKDFQSALPLVKKIIAPYLLNDGKETCSNELVRYLEENSIHFNIVDSATGGLLESTLLNPNTYQKISFSDDDKIDLRIDGLTDYWTKQNNESTLLTLHFLNHDPIEKKIPLRGRSSRVKQFAVEYICSQILKSRFSSALK